MTIQPGTQIAYIPTHAEWNIDHKDVEFGFVTHVEGEDAAWCRYWIRGQPGVLRTVANGELTPLTNLWVLEEPVVDQHIIIEWFQAEWWKKVRHV